MPHQLQVNERESQADQRVRRAWMCGLRDALRVVETPVRELQAQVDWCALHLRRLVSVLQLPVPETTATTSRPTAVPVHEPSGYVSALYGQMEEDDLR